MRIFKPMSKSYKTLLLSSLMITAFSASAMAQNSKTTAEKYPVDNTGRNARDVQNGPLTPENQSGKKTDVEITRQLRKSITGDKTLSTNAKNIKIITVDGKVTLRGPVKDEAEKSNIDEKAKKIAGTDNVTNELELTH